MYLMRKRLKNDLNNHNNKNWGGGGIKMLVTNL